MKDPVINIAQPVTESLYDRIERTGIDENYRVIRGIAVVGALLIALICLFGLWTKHDVTWQSFWKLAFLLVSLSIPLAAIFHQKASRKFFIAESVNSGLLGCMFFVFIVRNRNTTYQGDGKDAFLPIGLMVIVLLVKSWMALVRAAAFVEKDTN